jgi:hypothetical protein
MSSAYQKKPIMAVRTQQHDWTGAKNQGANVQKLEVSGIFLSAIYYRSNLIAYGV